MKVEGIWDIIAYDSTPMLYAEDTGSGLVWVQKDPLPAAPILTLPVTLVNDAAKAYLMRLDLGEGPQPYDILDLSAMFQLTSELTYDVSITEMFVLTTDPTTLTGPVWDNRIELNEGAGSNINKHPEHHGARTMARKWMCPDDGVDRSAYRYLGVQVAGGSSVASDPPIAGQYLKVDRDYGHFDYTWLRLRV